MGNQSAFCCKHNEKQEGTEINRFQLDEFKKHEKFEELLDKARAKNIIKDDPPATFIETKSQEIFENNQMYSIVPSNGEYQNNAEFADEEIEKAQEYQERYTSLYHSYVPNAINNVPDHKENDLTQNHQNEIDNLFLKQFYVNPDDFDNVNMEDYLNEKVKTTRIKHGNILEDPYLKNHFDKITHDGKIQLNIPPVYVDKSRKGEIYHGNWHVNKNIEITPNIQNLKSIMKFNGFGVCIKEDKSVIEGIFRDGELDGPGRVIVSNGDLFKGIYQNGFLNDKGIFLDYLGNRYDGQFKLNIMDGFGEESFVDNSNFKGEYKRNKKNGKGKFIWTDGSYYEGELLDNNLHGKGVYQWASGLRYEGDWYKGVMQGKGVITTPNGDYYEGEFKDNKKDGFGLFWWNDNKYYLGYWQEGVQNGYGKFFKEGKLMIGTWNKGKFEKHLEKEQIKFPKFNFHKRVTF